MTLKMRRQNLSKKYRFTFPSTSLSYSRSILSKLEIFCPSNLNLPLVCLYTVRSVGNKLCVRSKAAEKVRPR